jgi:hypothetical protein
VSRSGRRGCWQRAAVWAAGAHAAWSLACVGSNTTPGYPEGCPKDVDVAKPASADDSPVVVTGVIPALPPAAIGSEPVTSLSRGSGGEEPEVILTPSLPVIDLQLPVVISRWTYQPFLVNGRPMPFCYVLSYRLLG